MNRALATVIYVASDDDFKKGYEILQQRHPEFNWVAQGTFRQDVLNAVDEAAMFTMFLVDDIVFKEDFSLQDNAVKLLKDNDQMLSLSLRLHRGATYCYALNGNMRLPEFARDVAGEFMTWKYRGCDGDWGYGLSVDGNVYNTQFITWLLMKLDFHNPNSLEAALNHPAVNAGIRPMFLSCYDGPSKLLNVPANRVQNTFQNRNEESYTAEELNKKFLAGQQISLKNITGIKNFSVHYPIDYEFEERT